MVLMPRTTELFNLLINPISHDFALRWHRDDVKEDASLEEEKAALALWNYGVRTTLGLCTGQLTVAWLLRSNGTRKLSEIVLEYQPSHCSC